MNIIDLLESKGDRIVDSHIAALSPAVAAWCYMQQAVLQPREHPIVSYVPVLEGEDGYGPFKLIDKDGNIRGYCGHGYISALERYIQEGNNALLDQEYPQKQPAHPLLK